MTRAKEIRPAGNGTDLESIGGRRTPIVPNDELERRAEMAVHVVRVATTMRNGQVRVHHYANLPAAVRAIDRAHARGCEAVIGLCRVVPVPFDLDLLDGGAR